MHQFITSYQAGYQVISEVMQAENLPFPEVEEEKLKIFDNPDAFRKILADGKQIYELLGFSSDTLMAFYTVALHFLEEKEFIKAKDAFYFLTTLASNISSFWLSLAICYTELKQYEQALEAALSAIDLDPTNPECYLQALHLYKQQTNLEKATALCDKAIAFASEQPDEPWAHKLLELIEDAKLYINSGEF
jgi:tetratricopeptide (TPR) repeat protein